MINNLESCGLGCERYSAYDYDGLSLQELLCQFFTKINECIDDVNKYTEMVKELMDWIRNEGLAEEVLKILEQWKADGTLGNLINKVLLKEINDKVDALKIATTKTVRVPSDYATIQEAIDTLSPTVKQNKVNIEVLIETNHRLTHGLKCKNGDYSNFYIKSQDTVVKTATGFIGVGYEPEDAGFDVVESEGDNLIYGINCNMPVLGCKIDMENRNGSGYSVTGCTGMILENCGVINAGRRGIEAYTSRMTLKKTIWDGANAEGIRCQHGTTLTAMGSSADDCCKAKSGTIGVAAVYVSKGCLANVREGHFLRSGKTGLKVRRSRVDAERSDFSNAKEDGISLEGASMVAAVGCTANNCGGAGVSLTQSSILNGIAQCMNNAGGRAGNDIKIEHGSFISASNAQTTHAKQVQTAVGLRYEVAIEDTNVKALNMISGNGAIFNGYDNEPLVILRPRNEVTIVQFSNGFQINISKAIVQAVTVASGQFCSSPINKRNYSEDLLPKNIISSDIIVWGKENSNGGGRTIAVSSFHRSDKVDKTFIFKNEGVDIANPSSTGLQVQSVMVQEIIYGLNK